VEDVARRFTAGIRDRRHIAHVHGPVVENAHHHVADVGRASQPAAHLEELLLVGERAGAGLSLTVRPAHGVGELRDRHAARCERGRIGLQPEASAQPADERGFSDLRDCLHHIGCFGGEPPQCHVIESGAVKRQREDRHIVDGPRFHPRRARSRWHSIEIGLQLPVEADQRGFQPGADLETRDDQAATGARGRIEVFEARDLPKQLLQGTRDAVLDLRSARAWHGDGHVDHRHIDLRFLLPRQHQNREYTKGDRRDQG
jgi:hypothetical protein